MPIPSHHPFLHFVRNFSHSRFLRSDFVYYPVKLCYSINCISTASNVIVCVFFAHPSPPIHQYLFCTHVIDHHVHSSFTHTHNTLFRVFHQLYSMDSSCIQFATIIQRRYKVISCSLVIVFLAPDGSDHPK